MKLSRSPPHPNACCPIPTRFVPIPIVVLMKIFATNNLHILLLLVSNVLQINNIFTTPHTTSVYKHKLSTFQNMPCDAPVLFIEVYYSHNCIFTATTTHESRSCPQLFAVHPLPWVYCKFYPIPAALPWLLSPFPLEYRCYCPHYCGNTVITAVLPTSPSLCHSLMEILQYC